MWRQSEEPTAAVPQRWGILDRAPAILAVVERGEDAGTLDQDRIFQMAFDIPGCPVLSSDLLASGAAEAEI